MSIIFSLGLPLIFLVIFQQLNIPSPEYNIMNFTPGIIIFSYSFLTLFVATLIAKDRSTSLLSRLFASPMKPYEYIGGYFISLLPLTLLQSILLFGTSLLFKMPFNTNLILTILVLIPIALLFIALGITIGLITSEKASGPVGSLIVQLVAFTSGMWFDMSMTGKVFSTIASILPFNSILKITKAVLNGNGLNIQYVIVSAVYIVIFSLIAIILFKRKMVSDNK